MSRSSGLRRLNWPRQLLPPSGLGTFLTSAIFIAFKHSFFLLFFYFSTFIFFLTFSSWVSYFFRFLFLFPKVYYIFCFLIILSLATCFLNTFFFLLPSYHRIPMSYLFFVSFSSFSFPFPSLRLFSCTYIFGSYFSFLFSTVSPSL